MNTSRSFSQEEVGRFGRLSGDVNPIHVDPVAARRMIFNRPVVHGAMLIAWVLDSQMRHRPDKAARIAALKAIFVGPAAVGDRLALEIDGAWPRFRFRILCRDAIVTRGSVDYEDRLAPDEVPVGELPAPQTPAEVDHGAFTAAHGQERFDLGPGLELLFPHLHGQLPHRQAAVLAALTRIVGMRCPGLRSLLSEVDLRFWNQPAPGLDWKVGEYDERFGRLSIELGGAYASGTVIAFERPVTERSGSQAASLPPVAKDEFSDVKALVIGATRGLGEILARLLVAGGGEVVGTFHMGAGDAAALSATLRSGPGRCRFERFDIFDPDPAGLARITRDAGGFSHLFYTATPPIFVGAKGAFSDELFERFLDAYVRGFLRAFEAVKAQSPALAGVFLPSSVAVETHQPGLTEYAMAKAAAEAMIASLAARHPRIRFLGSRLPRLDTDQTINRSRIPGDDPAPLALGLLRELRL